MKITIFNGLCTFLLSMPIFHKFRVCNNFGEFQENCIIILVGTKNQTGRQKSFFIEYTNVQQNKYVH